MAGYRIQPFRPRALPSQRMREFGERLGELPADVGSDHDRLMRDWRKGGRGGQSINRDRLSGFFSPAAPWVTIPGSRLVLSVNYRRNYLLIANLDAAQNIWVNLGVAAQVNASIKIPPGGNWEPWRAPVNDIYVIGDAVGLLFTVVEGSA